MSARRPSRLGLLLGRASLGALLTLATVATVGALVPASAARAQAGTSRKEAELLVDRAEALAKAKRWTEAALLFDTAHKLDPTWDRPLRDLAFCYRRGGELTKAEVTYAAFLKQWPKDPAALFGQAETKRLLGKKAEAKDLFLLYLVEERRPDQAKLVEYATQKITELTPSPGAPAPSAKPAPPTRTAAAAPPPAPAPPATTTTPAATPPAATPSPAPAPVRPTPAPAAPGKRRPPAAERVPSRVLVLAPEGPDDLVVLREQIGTVTATELITAEGLTVETPDSVRRTLDARGLGCPDDDGGACYSAASGAGVRVDGALRQTAEGFELAVRFYDEVRQRETAKKVVRGRDQASLFSALKEALPELLAAHAIEADDPTPPVAAAPEAPSGRRVAGADAEGPSRATPGAPAKEKPRRAFTREEGKKQRATLAPKKGASQDGGGRDKPKPRKGRRVLDEEDEGDDDRERLDLDEKKGEGSWWPTVGWHTWTWGFVAAGLLIGASGLAVDFLLPTSANYTLDAADFIGPGAVAVGASAVVAAFALNPFWWIGNDDEAPDAKGE